MKEKTIKNIVVWFMLILLAVISIMSIAKLGTNEPDNNTPIGIRTFMYDGHKYIGNDDCFVHAESCPCKNTNGSE